MRFGFPDGCPSRKLPDGRPLNDHPTVRADIEKRTNFVVWAAANDNRLARDRGRAEIIRVWQFSSWQTGIRPS